MKKKICLIGYNYGKNVLINSINEIKAFKLIAVCGLKVRKSDNFANFKYYISWLNIYSYSNDNELFIISYRRY